MKRLLLLAAFAALCGWLCPGFQVESHAFEHAFIWDAKDGMQDLGTLGGMWSQAYAINSKGQVVGYAS